MKRLVLLFSLLLSALFALPAAAHEGREVGDYELVFGWRNEPALAGLFNGPEILIRPHGGGDLPADLAIDLQAEVTFGPETTTIRFRPAFGEPNRYIAELIPTLPGDYSFRVFGTIGDLEVDEVFNSADGEFSSVEPLEDILFPREAGDTAAIIARLEARIAELEARIAALESAGA